MKQKDLLYTLLLLALTACDGTGDAPAEVDDTPVPMAFTATAQGQTRATGITTANINSMGVFASYTGQSSWSSTTSTPNYMWNEDLSRTGSGPWTYNPVKYWPNTAGDKVSFFAYAPHTGTLPSSGALTVPGKSNKGTLSFTYTTPTDAANQTDLLIATPVLNRTKGSGTVAFSFRHVVAKVSFVVRATDAIKLSEVKITAATTSATFAADQSGSIQWGSKQTGNTTEFKCSAPTASVPADTPTEVATFFMLPTTVKAENSSGPDTTVSLHYSADGGATYEDSAVSLPKGWKEGDVAIYTLVLELNTGGPTELTVSVKYDNGMTWTDEGNTDVHDENPMN